MKGKNFLIVLTNETMQLWQCLVVKVVWNNGGFAPHCNHVGKRCWCGSLIDYLPWVQQYDQLRKFLKFKVFMAPWPHPAHMLSNHSRLCMFNTITQSVVFHSDGLPSPPCHTPTFLIITGVCFSAVKEETSGACAQQAELKAFYCYRKHMRRDLGVTSQSLLILYTYMLYFTRWFHKIKII